MRAILAVGLLLLVACGRPYHQKKDGDVDVALVLKRSGCDGSQKKERACRWIRAFDEADEAIATPEGTNRYLGWLRPIGPGGAPFGDAVALVVEKKNGRPEATLIVREKTGPDSTTVVQEWLEGKKQDDLDRFFETKEVSRRLDRVAGSPSSLLQMMERYTYVRRAGKRLYVLHVGSIEATTMRYGWATSAIWVGELRQVD